MQSQPLTEIIVMSMGIIYMDKNNALKTGLKFYQLLLFGLKLKRQLLFLVEIISLG